MIFYFITVLIGIVVGVAYFTGSFAFNKIGIDTKVELKDLIVYWVNFAK